MDLREQADRDAALDRILRHSALAGDPTASASCLEAETVAAMADGGLLPHEQAAAEDHASSCARCQQLLATVVRTAPAAPPRRAWWRIHRVPWLVPAAAAGLAVAVWVAVDTRPPRVVVSSVPVAVPERPLAPPTAQQDRLADMKPPGTEGAPDAAIEAPQRQKAQQTGTDAFASAKRREDAAAGQLAYGAPPPPSSPVPSSAPDPAAPAEMSRAAESRAARTRTFEADPAAGRLAETPLVPREVRSSDPRARWRIFGPEILRTVDGGTTWTPQATGTTARLTAGAAPQPDVCWVVGEEGTVLLSIDGLSWQRLNSPADASLVAVSATSAEAATVTASDGRTFATTDRGRTWVGR